MDFSDDVFMRWRAVAEAPDDPGTYQPALFVDQRGRLLTFGGTAPQGTHAALYAFDPEAGTRALVETAGEGPTGRTGFFWAYDPPTDRLVVFDSTLTHEVVPVRLDGARRCAFTQWFSAVGG